MKKLVIMATLVSGTYLMSTSCQPEVVTPVNTIDSTDSTGTSTNDTTNTNPNDTTNVYGDNNNDNSLDSLGNGGYPDDTTGTGTGNGGFPNDSTGTGSGTGNGGFSNDSTSTGGN